MSSPDSAGRISASPSRPSARPPRAGELFRLVVASAFALALGAVAARAQCVPLTAPGAASAQNFDNLSSTAGSTTNNLTITGWFLAEAGGGPRDNEQYAVDAGGSGTGDTYSYGASGAADRALGGLQSSTLISTVGACFVNHTGSTITSLGIAYTGEQWRVGNTAAARDDVLDFQFSTNATGLAAGAWTDVNALDFTNPIKTAAAAGALDGNAAANRAARSSAINGLSIADGATFWIRWNDFNAAGADDGLAVDDFSLTPNPTPDAPLTLISQVQGGGASSPLSGAGVTVRGVVTLLKSDGFFLQEETADNDADPNTSEGVFVFTSSAPAVAVGDQATVTGTVAEFNGLTELISPTVTVNSAGNTLPTAVTITAADLPPTAHFAQPQLEKYEAMRLAAASLTTVAPSDNFFDVPTVITGRPRPVREPGIPASDPVPPDPTSGTPDPNVAVWDENPERLILDTDGRQGSTGEALTSNVVVTNVAGPLDFAFGAYRLINEAALTRSANLSAAPVPTPADGEFTVASYNIENFNNDATQRRKVSLTVRTLLLNPDIIGAVEIFDLADLQALRDEINNDAFNDTGINPSYEAYLVEQDGTSGDNDQDVGFLVKTSRVSVTSVTQEREEETYINPNSGQPEVLHDRPPLVLDAVVDPAGASPQRVIVVVNHLRSFIDVGLVAGEGPRVREKRKKQAESLADLLNDLQTAYPGVPVISVGDYNAYEFSSGYDDSVAIIKGDPTPDDQIVVDQSPDLVDPNFFNLSDELPAGGRYSFIFEGTPQALDHHLVNVPARARNTRVAVARVNSDFPEAPAAAYASNASVPERHSDHDPVVSYYALGQPQATGTLIISEFRLSGPGGDEDEFVELYNNTDSDITVATLDGSGGWAIVTTDSAVIHSVPNGTVIPARGHYLVANEDGYSLGGYAGADAVYDTDIAGGAGLALFRTSNPALFDLSNRLDAAGYASAGELYREGAGIPLTGAEVNAGLQHSLTRQQMPGLPVDTGNNAADFIGVDVTGANVAGTQRLGAPGPENLASPRTPGGLITGLLLDATKPAAQSPNRVRDLSGEGNNPSYATFGTMSIRRRFVNNTGQDVTRLRFRIANITTFASGGLADLRAITSGATTAGGVLDAGTCAAESGSPAAPCVVNVNGTTLDQPPTQASGGGWNSSLSVGVITLGAPLAPGDSVNVQFLLGVQQTGTFRFFINVEAVTDAIAADSAKATRKNKSRVMSLRARARNK